MAAICRGAEETRRDFPDSPLVREPPQLRQGKPGAAVVGRAVHAIIGDMRNPQIMGLRSVAIVDLIKLCAAIVFGARPLIALGGVERRRRGGGGNPGFAERLSPLLGLAVDM